MEFNGREERRKIFRKELYTLKELGYLNQTNYDQVTDAHNQYNLDQMAKQEETAKDLQKRKIMAKPTGRNDSAVPSPPKRRLSAEEIRERNISWSLNLGVILLLIGGLFVATSNWASMSDFAKAGSIAFVSLLFFGIAYIASRLLKIEKTAFAFIVLGSLFLPIFILSLGWFRLLGSYLSFDGDGRYVLGTLGSLILVPLYGVIANKLAARMFVWFAFIALTGGVGFFLKALGLGIDAFYLGIMVYNSSFIAGFHFMKKRGVNPLFIKEMVRFVQVNLILSTLLLLTLFEEQVFNGFTILLTACLYLAMIFISGKKEYHFVFSSMIVYGAYQIFENWPFEEISPIGYALIGFVFLFVPRYLNDKLSLTNAFRWTSAIVSMLAFLYISLEGMLLRASEPSFLLMIAYLMIATNFVYLANVNQTRLFRYLSPFFLASAFFEATRIMHQWLEFETLIPIFFNGLILFIVFGWRIQHKWLEVIKPSSRHIGLGFMGITALVAMINLQWWELGLMLLLLGSVFHLILKMEERKLFVVATPWMIPVTVGFAFVSFGVELLQSSFFYHEELGVPFHFTGAGLVILFTAWSYKKGGLKELAAKSFFIGEVFYSFGLLLSLLLPMDEIWVRPVLWLVGIYLFYLLYQLKSFKWMQFVMGVISLISYFIIQVPLHNKILFTNTMDSFVLACGGALLLLTALYLMKKDRSLAAGFAWVGHVYLIPATLITFLIFGAESFWSMLLVTAIYALSYRYVRTEWKIKCFLYGTFTSLFFTLAAGLRLIIGEDRSHYAFLMASIMIGLFWYLSKDLNRKRSVYYLVPFSLVGLSSFLGVYPFSYSIYLIILCYAAGIILLLHQTNWKIVIFLPLLMVFTGTMEIIFTTQMNVMFDILLVAGIGLVLLISGLIIFPSLWDTGGKFGIKHVDVYSLAAFGFFATIYYFEVETFWAAIIHGVLISIALWLQRRRVPYEVSVIFGFSAGAYLLLPYYSLFNQFEIAPLWTREVLVLPWVVLTIYLQVILKGRWKMISSSFQWAILVIVSLLLIEDGLASSTVYDALILGSLSLVSMLAGMWLRMKTYFFVGSGVLLLNVLLQTRPFWGNLPWWGYLLIAGSILISVASFNEWNKQKAAKGEKTILAKLAGRVIDKLKQWN